MRRQVLYVTLPVCVAIVVAGAWLASAGDLNPPPGPVSPTMKTMIEVEPRIAVNETNTPGDDDSLFRITQPGSYYLAGNVTGESGKSGIEIAASDVTLDLNGFALIGVSGTLNGIWAGGSRLNIFNGTIRNWDGGGVSGPSPGSLFARLRVSDNDSTGLNISGEHCIIVDCTAAGNAGYGFWTRDYTIIERCTAKANDVGGFRGSSYCVFKKCIAAENNGRGFHVVDSVVTECTSSSNDGDGMYVSGSSLVLNNTCSRHTSGAGIRVVGDMGRIEANHVHENQIGIEAGSASDDNFIVRNTAVGNTTNYNIDSDNHYGQVITNPGAGFSNSNPWANFAFP